ncbi:hypothetical protein PHLCEN_2v197 [Hermanssonia centrifuga]|uniref:Uncharacterized protein n=1 Tax=Hermanssonia centrifuga TaxID=98765 RepID=A0A2R6S6L9_9APHY|nr:hypothetical protein PHLCEN_2v197 [Hermanssonia centrifuga]
MYHLYTRRSWASGMHQRWIADGRGGRRGDISRQVSRISRRDCRDRRRSALDWHRSKSPSVSLPSIVAFFKRRPDIAASVECLFLTAYWSDSDGIVDLAQDSPDSPLRASNSETLFLVLNQLPSLGDLRLTDVAVVKSHQPFLELVVDRHLDRLTIVFSVHLKAKSLLRLMSLFRSVKALSLIGIPMDEDPADNDVAGWPLPLYALKHLEFVELHGPLKPLFSTMLLSRPLLQSVEVLRMDMVGCHSEDMHIFEHLIAPMRSSLWYLEPPDGELFILPLFPWLKTRLRFYLVDPPSLKDTLLARLLVPRLEILHLRLRIGWDDSQLIGDMDDPARILSTIPRNSRIHTVVLEFQLSWVVKGEAKKRRDKDVIITRLEDILLALVATTPLKQVVVWFNNAFSERYGREDRSTFDEYVSCLADVFPRLREKDIFKLKVQIDFAEACHVRFTLKLIHNELTVANIFSMSLAVKAEGLLSVTVRCPAFSSRLLSDFTVSRSHL